MGNNTQEKQDLFSSGLFILGRNRCLFLLLSLVGLLLIYHFVFIRPLLIMTVMSITLIAGVYAVSTTRRNVVMAATIGFLVVVFNLAYFFHPSAITDLISSILLVIFYIYTLIRILGYVIRGQRITRDKIYGALSVYLLIGLAWAPLYRLVYLNDPAAFSGAQSAYEGIVRFDFIYYSFETICTRLI